MIDIKNITVGYQEKAVLKEVSLHIPRGSIVSVVGVNGCGKTTLLRSIVRQIPLMDGEILLNGRNISDYERRELARTAAILPQVRDVPAITVRSLVSHGRYPYLGMTRRLRAEDREIVRMAMRETGIEAWAERDLRELSGGERQRAYIAMALAQDADVILLDEPLTYLDIGRQFELMELIKKLNTAGKTVVMVLHDLAHALRYSDSIALLDEGRLICCGSSQEILRSGSLERVFGIGIITAEDGFVLLPKKE